MIFQILVAGVACFANTAFINFFLNYYKHYKHYNLVDRLISLKQIKNIYQKNRGVKIRNDIPSTTKNNIDSFSALKRMYKKLTSGMISAKNN